MPWGQVLSWCPDLKVNFSDGEREVVIGNPLLCGTAGRFIKLTESSVENDSCGLASIYYGQAQAAPLVSSSPSLVAELSGETVRDRDFRWKQQTNWHPLPGTPIRGFKRLFRDQSVNPLDLSIKHRPRAIIPFPTFDEAISVAADSLVEILRELQSRRVVIAMTAGLDSRTLLAAALAADVEVEAFTLEFDAPSVDVEIARKICESFGIKHTIGRARPSDQTRLDEEILRKHCLDSHSDAITETTVPNGMHQSLEDDMVFLRATCFEVGRDFYGQLIEPYPREMVTARAIGAAMGLDKSTRPDALDNIGSWYQWRSENDDGLSISDSFYLDQRLGGWAAMGELCHDALAPLSIQPANSDVMLRALMTPNLEARRSGALQKKLITELAPELNKFPINPKTFRHRTIRAFNRVRGYGRRLVGKVRL